MENPVKSDIEQIAAKFFVMLRSIDEFNEKELRGTLLCQLSPTVREQCFLGNYIRAIANVKTLLRLTNIEDCQAVAMIARSIFETGIEIALIDKIERGPEKIIVFAEVERLKWARKIVQAAQLYPSLETDISLHKSFIDRDGPRIDAKRSDLWPGDKRLSHWSQKDLRARAELTGKELLGIYDSEYQVHSWYVHSGVTGVISMNGEFYWSMWAKSFQLAAESFEIILKSMIEGFHLYHADSKLLDKLTYAKQVPFTKDPSQASALWNELVG